MTDASIHGQGALQRLAASTYGIVTPADALDVAALAGVGWAVPRFDRWSGIAVGVPAYLADIADGLVARRTHTASRFGEVMDHVIGDKPKVFYGVYHIWRRDLADKPLLAAVAAYNVANSVVTGYDWVRNAEPQIRPTRSAKRAMFASVSAVGVQVIATRVAKVHPGAGRALRWTGALLGYAGLGLCGLPTTRDYLRIARGGRRRRHAQR